MSENIDGYSCFCDEHERLLQESGAKRLFVDVFIVEIVISRGFRNQMDHVELRAHSPLDESLCWACEAGSDGVTKALARSAAAEAEEIAGGGTITRPGFVLSRGRRGEDREVES